MPPFTRIERQYYKDIGRFPVITNELEKELIARIQDGDKKAINELIIGNLRFVVSVARKYQNRGLSLLELINEGNLGLFKAAAKFKPEKKVKFTSYAVWWVRQSIQKALFDQTGAIKIPPNKLTLINKFRRALEANNGDYYKTIESEEFKKSEFDITDVLEKLSPLSLSTPINDSNGTDSINTVMDIIGVEAEQEGKVEKADFKNAINKILSAMTKREEKILRMYYGVDYDKEFTLEEIGNKLGLTRERVRQIKNKSLRRLFKNSDLRDQIDKPIKRKDSF